MAEMQHLKNYPQASIDTTDHLYSEDGSSSVRSFSPIEPVLRRASYTDEKLIANIVRNSPGEIESTDIANASDIGDPGKLSSLSMNSKKMDCCMLARAHWLLMAKNNQQQILMRKTLLYVVDKYPQTRPMWQFMKGADFTDEAWQETVLNDSRFRHHCSSMQAGITVLMDHLDDPHTMVKLLRDLGSRHFFYDAGEPHFELVQEGFMTSLFEADPAMDSDLVKGWVNLWHQIKSNIAHGIAIQRHVYISECVTLNEMNNVKAIWEQVRQFGFTPAGQAVTKHALLKYEELLEQYKVSFPVKLPEQSLAFSMFSNEIIKALNTTIKTYKPEKGFRELPKKLQQFVTECLMMDVCPTLMRKAFLHGLMQMLTDVMGTESMSEITVHIWMKIYRVLEQSIIWNVVHY